MKTTSFAALAAALLLAPVGAAATPASLTVKVADLDLSSPRGVARLDRRIHRAAATVCAPESQIDLRGRTAAERCVTATKAALSPVRAQLIAVQTAAPATQVATR